MGVLQKYLLLTIVLLISTSGAKSYENFNAAIYARVYEVRQMDDLQWLQERFDIMSKHIKVDKIYLETHRDMVVVEQSTLDKVKRFFHDRGIKTSGGITITVSERNRFETYCYSNPEHRRKLREVVEFTARNFDEVILDDFFFTNCKCQLCIQNKGERSWTDFRLQLLTDAAQELILTPARNVNPNVHVVIKYPNWYEHFQGLGFNLDTGPKLFDGLYTGTETRDPSSNQHLQAYLGYLLFRYLENLKPGGNRGGWVDSGGMMYADRYAEQLWLTLFAKAPEQTFFDFRQLSRPIDNRLRGDWQDLGSSLDFDAMMAPAKSADGSLSNEATLALLGGYALEQVDQFLGELGHPVGIKSYKPYHSVGEDFLQTYFGMIGIPMYLVPEFPDDANMIILTEQAMFDPDLLEKMKKQLMDGKNVLITSGLLRLLQDKGLDEIVELRYTDRKALVKQFRSGWGPFAEAHAEMLIPQIQYLTNDSWEEISAFDETNGWPMLHSAGYAKGTLYVLTIPESFTDLYNLPDAVLNRIRHTVSADMPVRLEGPAQICLFIYDNNTFIVESFLHDSAEVSIITKKNIEHLKDIVSGIVLAGDVRMGFGGRETDEKQFKMTLKPHSYRVFRIE
ncbi:hypothetical protein EH223_04495 [candidate division KSB1 bacterium]|nr:hypothetical protein [candidate division KSB1 bacterium]RQW05540.1 MAG: hypothetical protein EH223_04495 [candidate division KSB1 bacterium]